MQKKYPTKPTTKPSECSKKELFQASKTGEAGTSGLLTLTYGLEVWMGIYPGKIMLLPSLNIGKPIEVRATADQLEQIAYNALKSAIEMRNTNVKRIKRVK